MGRGGAPTPHTLITWSRGRSHHTTICISRISLISTQYDTVFLIRILVLDLKTHDLRPRSTPMMGRGIHPLYRRDPSWLGTLKVISTWPGLWRLRWCPHPHSNPLHWSRERSYLVYNTSPFRVSCKKIVLNGTHLSSTSGWFPAIGRGIHPLFSGCPPGVEYILNGFFSRPVWAKAGSPPPSAHNWVWEWTPFQAASMILPTYRSKWDD